MFPLHSPRGEAAERFWRRMPDWLVFAAYKISEPLLHSRARVGWCRWPSLCFQHVVRMSNRDLR